MGLWDFLGGGEQQPTTAQAPVPQNNAEAAFNFFVQKGLAPHQSAGIVGNLMGESGQGLNTSAVDRGDGRDGSDSIGIGQWNSSRAAALKNYAASKGTPWNDLNTQLEFLHSELQGPENKAYTALQSAKTPEEAARAFLGYERPKDWNVPGSHPQRTQYAVQALNSYGGGGQYVAPVSRVASAIMGTPQPAPPTPTAGGVASQLMGGFQPPVPPQQQGGGQPAPAIEPPTPMQLAPIQYAQRRSPDLSKLRALFKPASFT